MSRTRIKFCGVMRPEDAALAAEHGADAIGMIFYPRAKRCVSLDVAEQIVRALPPFVTPVGVFVDERADAMREIARSVGFRTIQLHGDERADVIAALSEFTIIKSVKVGRDYFGSTLKGWREAIRKHKLTNLHGLVLETSDTAQAGGTGVANDWSTIRDSQIAGLWTDLPAMIAAGGLTPETVGDVVESLHPFAVDVSSGVESELGIKSEEKIAAFVEAVRGAE
jgi:phosphoribosylanthranilate isomerase